ncbi:MAG TPA: hypothetical protein VN947_07975 [Polyangia bacterium]|nr:hypothetical protein [Polyangia bacterium]
MSVYRTKGTTLLSMQAVLDRRLGAGAFKRLATATGATWGLPLANGLYDAEELCRLTTAAATELGTTQLELFTASSEHNARHDLPTIHRIVLRVITPQLLLARGARFWRSYTAFGETRVARNEPGAFTGITDGIPPQLKDFVEGAWRGFAPAAVELAGGKGPHITEARWTGGPSWALHVSLQYR